MRSMLNEQREWPKPQTRHVTARCQAISVYLKQQERRCLFYSVNFQLGTLTYSSNDIDYRAHCLAAGIHSCMRWIGILHFILYLLSLRCLPILLSCRSRL